MSWMPVWRSSGSFRKFTPRPRCRGAEAVDGRLITADRKFFNAVTGGSYGRRLVWVEDLPRLT